MFSEQYNCLQFPFFFLFIRFNYFYLFSTKFYLRYMYTEVVLYFQQFFFWAINYMYCNITIMFLYVYFHAFYTEIIL